MFAQLKEKLAAKLDEFKGTPPPPTDPLEKHVTDLVEKATSEELIAPDWSLMLEVVDFVNSNPAAHSDKTCKAMNRMLHKRPPSTKTQLLTCTVRVCVGGGVEDRSKVVRAW